MREREKLAKKHKSLKADLLTIVDQLTNNPKMGSSLGKDCYKIRVAISSKGKGKSGGARLITYVRIVKETVFLLDIYNKSDQTTITDKELKALVQLLAED